MLGQYLQVDRAL